MADDTAQEGRENTCNIVEEGRHTAAIEVGRNKWEEDKVDRVLMGAEAEAAEAAGVAHENNSYIEVACYAILK